MGAVPNGRKDVTIKAPAARSGGRAPMPGGLIAEPAASIVTPSPAVHVAQGGVSDQEIIGELGRTVARLEAEKRTLQTASSTMSTIALALSRMCLEHDIAREDGNTVRIDRDFIMRATGGRLVVKEDRGDILIRIARDGTVDLDFGTEG